MAKKRMSVTLEESDIERVRKVEENMGTNFSEALRFIIRAHEFMFGERIIIPRPDAYHELLETMEER